MDNGKNVNSNEYIYFKCHNGHENYIFWDKQQKNWQEQELVVTCQHCEWKSSPFYPNLFQHSSQGEFLLWVYTTKNINAIQSVFNLQIESSPQIIAGNPLENKKPELEKTLPENKVDNTNIQPIEVPKKRHSQTVKLPKMSRKDLDSIEIQTPVTNILEQKELKDTSLSHDQIKKHSQTVKLTKMNRNEFLENKDSIQHKKHSQTVKLPKMSRNEFVKMEAEIQENEKNKAKEIHKKNSETVRLSKSQFENIKEEKVDILDSYHDFSEPESIELESRSNSDTLELSVKGLNLEKDDTIEVAKPQEVIQNTWGPNDRIKLQQNYFLFLILNFLWLFAVAAIVALAYHFFSEQNKNLTNSLTNSLLSIKNEISNIEFPEISISNPSIPVDEPKTEQDARWKTQYQKLYQEYKDVARNLKEEKNTSDNREKELKALLVSYRDAQNKNSSLEDSMDQVRQENYRLLEQIAELKKSKDSIPDVTTAPDVLIKNLTLAEEDYNFPVLSQDKKFMIFYRDEDAGRNKVRRYLNLAFINNDQISQPITLFQSPIVKLENREIPFVFDWNGVNRVILLTRIEGLNTVYQLFLNIDTTNQTVTIDTKELTQVRYPITLGPPALSPDQKYFACIYQRGNSSLVRIHNLLDGRIIHSIPGGGDTLRTPLWSQDSRRLLFLENNSKSIAIWEFPGDKRIKNISDEIYGRYLSASPEGNRIAFFKNSLEGSGTVDICLWNWTNLDNPIEMIVKSVQTAETSKIQWMKNYFVFIKKGEKDEVIFTDYTSKRQYNVFSKEGRIEWLEAIDNDIIFSYKEGLFTRPYLIEVK